MNKNAVTIEIARPVEVVFEFTVDPTNTPKWIESIVVERRSDKVVAVGTTYANVSKGKSRETIYEVIAYEPNRLFQLRRVGSDYVCTYIFEAINQGYATKLTYTEEVGSDQKLVDPLGAETFENLKAILESGDSSNNKK